VHRIKSTFKNLEAKIFLKWPILFLVLWRCWPSVRKAHKTTVWWGHDIIICLEWGAYCLLMVQPCHYHPQTPLSLASLKSCIIFTFLIHVCSGCPGKESVKWVFVLSRMQDLNSKWWSKKMISTEIIYTKSTEKYQHSNRGCETVVCWLYHGVYKISVAGGMMDDQIASQIHPCHTRTHTRHYCHNTFRSPQN